MSLQCDAAEINDSCITLASRGLCRGFSGHKIFFTCATQYMKWTLLYVFSSLTSLTCEPPGYAMLFPDHLPEEPSKEELKAESF